MTYIPFITINCRSSHLFKIIALFDKVIRFYPIFDISKQKKQPIMKNLTQNEENVLYTVCRLQDEDGHSEYTSVDSPNEKGILGSLVKKGLVYDCYEGVYKGLGYMYCLTQEGIKTCNELGISTKHIHFFN